MLVVLLPNSVAHGLKSLAMITEYKSRNASLMACSSIVNRRKTHYVKRKRYRFTPLILQPRQIFPDLKVELLGCSGPVGSRLLLCQCHQQSVSANPRRFCTARVVALMKLPFLVGSVKEFSVPSRSGGKYWHLYPRVSKQCRQCFQLRSHYLEGYPGLAERVFVVS